MMREVRAAIATAALLILAGTPVVSPAQARIAPAAATSRRAPAATSPRLAAAPGAARCTRSTTGQRFGVALAIGAVGAVASVLATSDGDALGVVYVAGSAGGAMLAAHYCHEPARPIAATLGAIAGLAPVAVGAAQEAGTYQDGPGPMFFGALLSTITVPLGAAVAQGLAGAGQ